MDSDYARNMKKGWLILAIGLYGCAQNSLVQQMPQMTIEPMVITTSESASIESEQVMKLQITIGTEVFTATFASNTASRSLIEHLSTGPLTLSLQDYGGFEKVGDLGISLPHEDQPYTSEAGDIVLYQGDQIVMFYGQNAWSYTVLAHVDDLNGWQDALGHGTITVELSLKQE